MIQKQDSIKGSRGVAEEKKRTEGRRGLLLKAILGLQRTSTRNDHREVVNKKTKDVQPIKQVHFRKQWEQQGDTMHPPPEALYHPPEVRGEETPLQDTTLLKLL